MEKVAERKNVHIAIEDAVLLYLGRFLGENLINYEAPKILFTTNGELYERIVLVHRTEPLLITMSDLCRNQAGYILAANTKLEGVVIPRKDATIPPDKY